MSLKDLNLNKKLSKMKRLFALMLMTVALLFTVSAQSIPAERDIGYSAQTEVNEITVFVNQTSDVSFCQRTDMQNASNALLYAMTEELICPAFEANSNSKYITNYQISWTEVASKYTTDKYTRHVPPKIQTQKLNFT